MNEILDIKISVVIPTHKPIIPFLRRTLETLANQEGVDHFRYEILVVENPKKTPEVVELLTDLNISNLKHLTSPLGSNEARNTGILESKHNYVALLDDDCVPCSDWLFTLIHTHFFFPNVGIIGGPLSLNYQCEQPKWLVKDFLPLLSAVDWENDSSLDENLDYPFDIIEIPERYMVSANLSFTKKRYDQAGRFNTKIGLHGKEVYISNDEIQFVERAAKCGSPKMLWVPQLKMEHLIPEERCQIEFLENKAHGQGYSDGIMWKEECPDSSISDLYHNFLQIRTIELIKCKTIAKARLKIANEPDTRLFIKNLIRTKIAYMCGAINALSGETWIRK